MTTAISGITTGGGYRLGLAVTTRTPSVRVGETSLAESQSAGATGEEETMAAQDAGNWVAAFDPIREIVVFVPEREAWLFRNPEALASVYRGLEQARTGQTDDNPPDLDADDEWLNEIEDNA